MKQMLLVLGCAFAFSCAPETYKSPLLNAQRVSVNGEGEVQELLRAKGYTYLRLANAQEGEWLVVSHRPPKVGSQVAFRGYAKISNFRSRTLDRAFPELIFSFTTSLENR